MKLKLSKINLFIFCIFLTNATNCVNYQLSNFATIKAKDLLSKKHKTKHVLFERWVKYFHYIDSFHKKPTSFFINPNYKSQQDSEKIPSKFSFYVMMQPQQIVFMLSKGFHYIYDNLNFDSIEFIPEDSHYTGGVIDLGKFNEGYCFQITTIKPNNDVENISLPQNMLKEIWLICLSNQNDKEELMKLIISQKLELQREIGINNRIEVNKYIDKDVNDGEINENNLKENDGYWIVVHDWSECSHKCGGGKQIRQLQCVPPKNGGKPCKGNAIRERSCNVMPCIDLNEANEENNNNYNVKSISNIINNKCTIKETNALYIDSTGKSIPIKLIMNDKTITAFENNLISNITISFVLENTSFLPNKKISNCFILQTLYSHAEFCSLSQNNKKFSFVNEWKDAFLYYKTQCNKERNNIVSNLNEEIDYIKQKEVMKQQFIKNKMNQIKIDNHFKEQEKEFSNQKKKIEEMTIRALLKEQNDEEQLLQEEEAKEEEELSLLQEQLEQITKRKDYIDKERRMKQIENDLEESKLKAKQEIEKMRQNIQEQILSKREDIKKVLKQKKLRFNEKKKELLRTINTMKSNINNIIQQSKEN